MEALRLRKRLREEAARGASRPGSARRSGAALRSRAGMLVAALAAAALLAGFRPAAAPGDAARALGPLPDCRYDDILTEPRGYDDWSITLVDTILRVTKRYVPPDLVDVAEAGLKGGGQVRALVIDDLRAMGEAAALAGNPIAVQSSYRSYASQEAVFATWVGVHGYRRALQLSARPGHSEHQLGLAIDFRSSGGGSPFEGNWGTTPAGKWMRQHAWEYGFLMSYPRRSIGIVCYDYEPWHFRYVGRELAAAIHASGLTIREYLWANYTTAVVPPPTPRPSRTPRPSAAPTLEATAAPGASPSASVVTAPPTTPPTVAPATPNVSAAPSLGPSGAPPEGTPAPGATPPPGDAEPADAGAALVAGLGVGLAGLLLAGWMVLRRGRSRAGL